ncbi:hypothetical protein WMY93_002472 [Mugilogobius chulae]|uniref:Uncharacterized protein n=1 Tax=Mugilogobius chulae TaxID=88201 RepID=A0AAW0PTX0_9GOBI
MAAAEESGAADCRPDIVTPHRKMVHHPASILLLSKVVFRATRSWLSGGHCCPPLVMERLGLEVLDLDRHGSTTPPDRANDIFMLFPPRHLVITRHIYQTIIAV